RRAAAGDREAARRRVPGRGRQRRGRRRRDRLPALAARRRDHRPGARRGRRSVGVSEPPLLSRISTILGTFVGRHPRPVLAVTVALLFAAVVPATRFRIQTDLTALLPDGAPAAQDYRVFLQTFGGFEKVFVLVRAPAEQLTDSGPLTDAAEQLAEILRKSPEVADARSGLTEEDERFFFHYVAPRLPLLQDDTADLARRVEPAALHDRVATMREAMRSPAGSVAGKLFANDPLGLSEGLLAAASSALPMDPISGAFVSRQGDAALVILTPARAEIDPAGGRALLAEL